MDLHQTIFELIDLRSFSNLWFWIALAVMWSTASHWVLGVPFDMVLRARKYGEDAERDLHEMVRINVNRLLHIGHVSGLWLMAFVSFLLTGLVLLGFLYRVEFVQALFLLMFPMSLVFLLSLRTARDIRDGDLYGELLRARLLRHRFFTQMLGVVSIFFTALWGMYQNLSLGALGG